LIPVLFFFVRGLKAYVRAADGNRIFFKSANPVKSRRKAHCLQSVYRFVYKKIELNIEEGVAYATPSSMSDTLHTTTSRIEVSLHKAPTLVVFGLTEGKSEYAQSNCEDYAYSDYLQVVFCVFGHEISPT